MKRVLQLSMLHPFEGGIARRFAMGLSEILVVEEKRPFIELHLRDTLKAALSKTRGEPDTSNVIAQLDLLIDEATIDE